MSASDSYTAMQEELRGIYALLVAKAKAGELTVCERTVRERIFKLLEQPAPPPEKEPEVRLNEDGTLDEIAHPAAHLEQMDHNHWFLEVGPNGNSVAIWLHAKGKITATYEHRRDATLHPAATHKE